MWFSVGVGVIEGWAEVGQEEEVRLHLQGIVRRQGKPRRNLEAETLLTGSISMFTQLAFLPPAQGWPHRLIC